MATALQAEMLINIAENEYTSSNGAQPLTFGEVEWVWADVVIENARDKGTFTSLVVAGLAKHDGNVGKDACVTLTEEGFNEYFKLIKG